MAEPTTTRAHGEPFEYQTGLCSKPAPGVRTKCLPKALHSTLYRQLLAGLYALMRRLHGCYSVIFWDFFK